MTFKTFLIALFVTFGFPWLFLVAIPFAKMRTVEPVLFTEAEDGRADVYVPRRPGRITDGAEVYGANGCYLCHTQLIRPSFAGSDLGREGWAGFTPTKENPTDTRRESTPYDYAGEAFAQIGLMRSGPDLSNVGNRIDRYVVEEAADPDTDLPTAEAWVFNHLYDPRSKKKTYWSTCPSQRHLFVKRKVEGQGSPDAVRTRKGKEYLPSDEIRALASYLLSLKKDDAVPYSINYSRDKQPAGK